MAHFSDPTIHGVNTVTASAEAFTGSASLELTFHGANYRGPNELKLDIFFQPEQIEYVRALAAFINQAAVVPALQAAE